MLSDPAGKQCGYSERAWLFRSKQRPRKTEKKENKTDVKEQKNPGPRQREAERAQLSVLPMVFQFFRPVAHKARITQKNLQ